MPVTEHAQGSGYFGLIFSHVTFQARNLDKYRFDVHFTLGTQRFFLARSVINCRPTSGEAARKTSGPERYDLPFPLNFDLFLSDLI